MVNTAFPVSIQTMELRGQGIVIYYPQVMNLPSMYVQERINRKIYELVHALIRYQYAQQEVDQFEEMIGTFEMKTNERHVLSITFSNYAYAPYHAHGLTIMKSLTFDVQTGENYSLEALFKQNSDYINRLSTIVKQQIHERNIDIINHFTEIASDQDYYIADQVLVLYFQLYEITPYYVGIPLFPVPLYQMENVLSEEGPLGKLLAI